MSTSVASAGGIRMNSSRLLAGVVSAALARPRLVLLPTTRVAEVRGWNSLVTVDILLAIESQLGIEFHYTELRRLRTVADYLDLIDSRS